MINKKLIHFKTFDNFNSKKLSANQENTLYTVGLKGTVTNGSPDISYSSIVFIKDTKQIWTHGAIYSCPTDKILDLTFNSSGGTLADGVYTISVPAGTNLKDIVENWGKIRLTIDGKENLVFDNFSDRWNSGIGYTSEIIRFDGWRSGDNGSVPEQTSFFQLHITGSANRCKLEKKTTLRDNIIDVEAVYEVDEDESTYFSEYVINNSTQANSILQLCFSPDGFKLPEDTLYFKVTDNELGTVTCEEVLTFSVLPEVNDNYILKSEHYQLLLYFKSGILDFGSFEERPEDVITASQIPNKLITPEKLADNARFSGMLLTGTNHNQLSITVTGLNKWINLYDKNEYGWRRVAKTDNGGKYNIFLISELPDDITIEGLLKYGFTGTIFAERSGGYPKDDVVHLTCILSHMVNELGLQLQTSNDMYIPLLVTYNGKNYLGISTNGGNRLITFIGSFYRCLNDFIEVQGTSATPLAAIPNLTYQHTNYILYYYPYNAKQAQTATTVNDNAITLPKISSSAVATVTEVNNILNTL